MNKIKSKPTFAICYACDDNYEMLTAISMLSLLENNPNTANYIILILGDNLSAKTKDHFAEMAKAHNCEIKICNVRDDLDYLKVNGCRSNVANNSLSTYSRLFFEKHVPDEVERLLYIDSDTIVNSDISFLYNFNLNEDVMAAVWDFIPVKYNRILGIDTDNHYVNAGVLLIDVKKWKNGKYQDKIVNHLTQYFGKYCFCDQDIINIVLEGKIAKLPPEYNFFPQFQQFTPAQVRCLIDADETQYYTDAELINAKKCPRIIHYVSGAVCGQPWIKGNSNELSYIWDSWLEKSIYKGYIKKRKKFGKRVITRTLYRVLPRNVFVLLYRIKGFGWMKEDMYEQK